MIWEGVGDHGPLAVAGRCDGSSCSTAAGTAGSTLAMRNILGHFITLLLILLELQMQMQMQMQDADAEPAFIGTYRVSAARDHGLCKSHARLARE